ncbi:hypothetical protein BDQ12DRAFT_733838 [Crucibulum laeve]|uniref:SET domain-containing protein n=1 Tax=Crucibulum laeve TaxID=68775 RepID=A0A5C3M5M6_9AGAR|nr:hypothetical protein BDQ12DRAFT_733838 [Crucibulum laeve]
MASSSSSKPATPLSTSAEHLNSSVCVIKIAEGKSRGVYASRPITRNTTIEISPVLFFSKEEYENHGKYTVLDHYAFKWADGRMALALGLGSLFNHSDTPNVSFTLDSTTDSIRYTTVSDVNTGDELQIFYGHKLWFSPVDEMQHITIDTRIEDGWGGLSAVIEDTESDCEGPFLDGNPDEIIPDEDLPFTRFKLPPEEEEPGSIRTVQAWVVDIPDPRHITTMLKWLKKNGLETPDLGHLKRIRKHGDTTTFLLTTAPDPPSLPEELNLPQPVQTPVPNSSALTQPSLHLKSALWPTVYTPRRKGESEGWSRGKVRWAWQAMKTTVEAAINARRDGELPIAAHIPPPYESLVDLNQRAFTACDTRRSTNHPLRHAAINAIRCMADYRASADLLRRASPSKSMGPESSFDSARDESQNGTNYLLTSRTFFITHEPCIMCSMALLHSRVKEVVYLYPMTKTGGCGGSACLPTLNGVNHRFGICTWNEEKAPVVRDVPHIDPTIDV